MYCDLFHGSQSVYVYAERWNDLSKGRRGKVKGLETDQGPQLPPHLSVCAVAPQTKCSPLWMRWDSPTPEMVFQPVSPVSITPTPPQPCKGSVWLGPAPCSLPDLPSRSSAILSAAQQAVFCVAWPLPRVSKDTAKGSTKSPRVYLAPPPLQPLNQHSSCIHLHSAPYFEKHLPLRAWNILHPSLLLSPGPHWLSLTPFSSQL